MNTYLMNVELAKAIDRVRQDEAEKRRLLRQIQTGQASVQNHLGLHIGKLAMALAIALRLR